MLAARGMVEDTRDSGRGSSVRSRERHQNPDGIYPTDMAVVVKTNGIPFWGRCTTHLEPILVGMGMFTGGTGI